MTRMPKIFWVLILLAMAGLVVAGWVSGASPSGTAEITYPRDYERVSGTIEIQGTATGESFDYYKLEYGVGTRPSAWIFIAGPFQTPVTAGKLGTWDTTTVYDGYYTLRLVVVDNVGNFTTATARVIVENDKPNPEAVAQYPRRGCQACHKPPYTLQYEALSRGSADHPSVPSDATVELCLTCHASAENGKGAAAPTSLRDILHPSHMFSEHFIENYKGNCFTCHNVEYDGSFVLLDEKVETNDKGVPKVVPIPGTISP